MLKVRKPLESWTSNCLNARSWIGSLQSHISVRCLETDSDGARKRPTHEQLQGPLQGVKVPPSLPAVLMS